MKKKIDLSIVIPVYGSEKVLEKLVDQIRDVLDGNENYEIIFVCDKSPDDSWKVIQSLSIDDHRISGILLRMNAGQHNSLMAGLARASGKIIVTMDDDLQHSPKDIPLLVSKIKQGYDVAYANFNARSHQLWKIVGSRLTNSVATYLLQKPKELYLSPFRTLSAEIKNDILNYQGPYVYLDGLILSVTKNITSVDVEHYQRYAGESGYGLRKSISLWLKMATSFSIVPLRLTSLLGLFFSGIGFILAIVSIIQKLTINVMPTGWSSLIVAVLIMGGVQLLALGMIGEYLGRVLLTINARPQYVIEKTIGFKQSEIN